MFFKRMRISIKLLNNLKINFIVNNKNNSLFIRNFTSLNKRLFLNEKWSKFIYLKIDLNNLSNNNDKANHLIVNKNDQQDNKQKKQQERKINPIRKLLRVKDLVDFIFLSFLFAGTYIGYKNYKEKKENESKFEMEWLNAPNLKHKLFKCNGYFLPEFLSKNLNNIKNFQTRKDDVWVVSFPKSGTTWVQEIVYLLANDLNFEKAKLASIEARSPFIDFPSPGVKYINNSPSPRIIKTHMPLLFLPDNVQNDSKVIYIIRNPKDVCVSYYHFAKMSTEAEYTGSFNDFSNSFADGIVPYGPWWKHVNEYTNKSNIHIIHYEDLHLNPRQTVEELGKFLGKDLDDNQIDSLIKWCSFDNMKKNPSVNYDWYKEIGLFRKDGNFFRKGKIGDWLNHFDYSISKRFDEIVDTKLIYKAKKLDFGLTDEELNKIYEYQNNKKN